jgi:hypothetical protein
MWYLHSHFTCDKLFQSLTPISFPTYPFGALGEEIIPLLTGKAYQVRTSKAGGLTSLVTLPPAKPEACRCEPLKAVENVSHLKVAVI